MLAAIAAHLADMDLVITTAQIPGRPAPRLVTAEMVPHHAARLGDRRPRRRDRRQLRADARRRDGGGGRASPSWAPSTCRPPCRYTPARCTAGTCSRCCSTSPRGRRAAARPGRRDHRGHAGRPRREGPRPRERSSSSSSTSSSWPASSASWSSPGCRRCCTRRSCRPPTPSPPSRWSARWCWPAPTAAASRTILGFIAVICATINVVGGFIITDRMLKMFRRGDRSRSGQVTAELAATDGPREVFIEATYLAASVLFILGLRSLTVPDKARRGMQQAAVGMLLAIVGTLVNHEIVTYGWILAGLVAGHGHRLAAGRLGADDGDAAADRHLATCSARWRRRWSAWPSTTTCGSGAAVGRGPDGGARLRGAVRRAHRHRQLHGLREAAGAPARAADHLPGPERRSTSLMFGSARSGSSPG